MAGINSFFWLLIIAHLTGDFYLQSKQLACNKKESFKLLLVHSGLYALPVLIIMIPYIGIQWWWCALAFASITVSHGIIDLIKIKLCAKFSNYEKLIFFTDQFLHVLVIYLIASIYAINNLIALNSIGISLLGLYKALATGYPAGTLIKTVCAFLLIFKPSNIIIKTLKPISTEQADLLQTSIKTNESNKAGSMIGNLERILILILLMFNQYTAIAFILTAKSITRYNKIVEDPPFAEYYLIGTLTSVIIAVLASLIAK